MKDYLKLQKWNCFLMDPRLCHQEAFRFVLPVSSYWGTLGRLQSWSLSAPNYISCHPSNLRNQGVRLSASSSMLGYKESLWSGFDRLHVLLQSQIRASILHALMLRVPDPSRHFSSLVWPRCLSLSTTFIHLLHLSQCRLNQSARLTQHCLLHGYLINLKGHWYH